MSLYDRVGSFEQTRAFASESAMVNFVKTTYKFFCASLLFATIGSVIGLQNFEMVVQNKWVFFIAEILAFLGLIFSKSKPGINVAMLFIFTTLTGVTLVPLLGFVIMKSGMSAVWQALGMTTIIFGVMSIFALKTKSDLANMGKMLFIALLVVIVCSLLNYFLLKSPVFQIVIAGASAILFSLFVAYDTQNMMRGLYDSPVDAALNLYLDFLNIFIVILQLTGLLGSRDD
ncbi:Bax inhibitor-1/YccA family protein [Helicobacter mustelae]|uniref:Putative integral membrane protein n=1 Tax=Helicobacter mustelae (strain ATCC 43772 / CCUG 25715 / CIP 103759 / LMG 18044 / NCTC 12198 / R85-136P) TaxID=679897 RepID=D3UJE1_HELM1|nr:Bax inhibitor-1/YccA family protein [Helicobacter mustelae]CBG40617.1 putative integral membrane protein [Helicobacter mustelae 12198]SQH72115.1 Integral membrane protein [Helicobacter mustelae]STP13258.1 Integral membrane protein [Helicobacter mustelae]